MLTGKTAIAVPITVRLIGWLLLPVAYLCFFAALLAARSGWEPVPWLLLLGGSVGLIRVRRWGAVLVCAVGWFLVTTVLLFGGSPSESGPVVLGVAAIWTVLVVGSDRHLKPGF